MTRLVDVYLVSSTLHFFWAFMLAKRFSDERDSHLILIDQYANRPLKLWDYLTPANTPFVSQQKLEGRELSGWSKLQNRQKQFKWVKSFVNNSDISTVWIGSDRSVLGQWFIKQAKQKNNTCVACYMDDGVFSYLGRSASQSFSERYLDAFFKKIIYGFWYDSPITVGASKWIDEVWVMYPRQVNALLRSKQLVEIYPNNHGFKAMAALANEVLAGARVSLKQLAELDVLITLPNQTLFSKIEGYEQALHELLESLLSKGLKVALKYHPAVGKQDPLSLSEAGLWVLPSHVSFEVLLPFLHQCTVIGDMSTTILLANYAQTIRRVIMVRLKDGLYVERMASLCERVSIEVTDVHDLVSSDSVFGSCDPLAESLTRAGKVS